MRVYFRIDLKILSKLHNLKDIADLMSRVNPDFLKHSCKFTYIYHKRVQVKN